MFNVQCSTFPYYHDGIGIDVGEWLGTLGKELVEQLLVKLLLQGCAVAGDAGDIPLVACTTGHDAVFAGVAIDETRLVPVGGYLLHEVNSPCGSIFEVVGSHSEVLHARLEEDGSGQCEDIAGLACGAMLVVLVIVLVDCASASQEP